MIYVWKPKRDFGPQTFRLQNSEFRIQNSEFRIQNSEFRIQNSEFRIQTSEFRIQNSEFRLQTSDFRLQTSSELRLQTWDLRLLWTSDFGLQTLGTSLPIFHSLLLCTNMDDVSRLPYRGALRGKKDYVGASFGLQFKWFGTSACLVRHKRQGERHPTACCGKGRN